VGIAPPPQGSRSPPYREKQPGSDKANEVGLSQVLNPCLFDHIREERGGGEPMNCVCPNGEKKRWLLPTIVS